MRIVVDMNLSPRWVQGLLAEGIESVHWSAVGAVDATDEVVMVWARERSASVLTHDLDFAAILASTGASGPSVIQLRTADVGSDVLMGRVAAAIRENVDALRRGAIVSIDVEQARVRVLPIVQE